jgi:predicted phage tail protein
MMEVRLHGSLGRDFGKVWNLEVYSVREAMNAICALKPGFRQAVLALDRAGLAFKVRAGRDLHKAEELGEEDLELNLTETRVDVVPIMRGAGAAGRIIAGVVLVIVAVVYGYYSEDWATAGHIGMAGVSLIIGGVAQLLSPQPKKQQFKDDIKSWTINGPLNTTDQGNPVPVVYGEVLTGGVPISAGLNTIRNLPYDTVTPDGSIGGDFDEVMRFGGPVAAGQIVMRFSVSPINLNDVSHYSWTVTGYSAATSHTIAGNGTATISVTITYNIGTQTVTYDNFTVSCSMTGKSTTQRDGDGPLLTGATVTRSGTVTIDTHISW